MDVRLFHTPDDGDIEYVNGQAVVDAGFETAAYLSLFGGNERDGGGDGTKHLQWWGNLGEPVAERRYRSETQHLLQSLPATPANLRRAEDAAGRDLAWMIEAAVASSIEASASMPAVGRVKFQVAIFVQDRRYESAFMKDWASP